MERAEDDVAAPQNVDRDRNRRRVEINIKRDHETSALTICPRSERFRRRRRSRLPDVAFHLGRPCPRARVASGVAISTLDRGPDEYCFSSSGSGGRRP